MKSSKGITLVALIITIIVMLILAGISISIVIGEDGLIAKAQSAIRNYKIAEVKEIILTDLNSRYKDKKGKNIENETIQAIAELSVDYDISPEKFSVHYIENKNLELILIREDKVSKQEIQTLKEYIVEYYKEKGKTAIKDNVIISRGDYNKDGFITGIDFFQIYLANNIDKNMLPMEEILRLFDYDDNEVFEHHDINLFNLKYGVIKDKEWERLIEGEYIE